ncbi:MAG: hypothetical protein L6R35_002430 [Caloplaca aegaea]|nr:MAG: hypothetical protein L6R35_002430 [Caloplaca aegaea]
MHFLRSLILSFLAHRASAGVIREMKNSHAAAAAAPPAIVNVKNPSSAPENTAGAEPLTQSSNNNSHHDNLTSFDPVKRQTPHIAPGGPEIWLAPIHYGSHSMGNNKRVQTLLGRLMKDRSNRHICDLVQGYEGDVNYEYFVTGKRCDTLLTASDMTQMVHAMLNYMMWNGIDGGCLEFWNRGPWRGHLQITTNYEPIKPGYCWTIGADRPWDHPNFARPYCDICGAHPRPPRPI